MAYAKWSFGRYSALLAACVFGTAFAAFVVFYFAPLLLSQRDSQLPAFASAILGPLGALAGLMGFWIYVLRFHRGT
jgi:hypothetical protein